MSERERLLRDLVPRALEDLLGWEAGFGPRPDVDPEDLTIRTYVNGALAQEGHTGSDLLFPFAYQRADVSRLMALEPVTCS